MSCKEVMEMIDRGQSFYALQWDYKTGYWSTVGQLLPVDRPDGQRELAIFHERTETRMLEKLIQMDSMVPD
jgi:hypothetical protein